MKTVYSILQFRRSLLKDEIFNIGIAFGFVHENGNKVLFRSTDYSKLKNIYSQLNEQMLAIYMDSIQKRIEESVYKILSTKFDYGFFNNEYQEFLKNNEYKEIKRK